MKTFVKFIVICITFLFLNISHASNNLDTEFMDDDEVDYDSSSVQTSSPDEEDGSVETREQSEYDIDMRPYVSFKYTSTKTKIERN